jgi:FkbM family methyltransferase
VLRNLARLPLRIIPAGAVLPILSGALRGYKWTAGSGVQSVWLGWYEAAKMRALQSTINEGDIFFDVGAHAGVYSLAAARRLGVRGFIVAIEPSTENAELFERHMRLNGVSRYRLIRAAASDKAGEARFNRGLSTYEGRLNAAGDVNVPTIRLDDIDLRPSVIKIDVEGHEAAVLVGATRILEADRPIVFVAVHTSEARNDCVRILDTNGYEIKWLEPDELVAHPRRINSATSS